MGENGRRHPAHGVHIDLAVPTIVFLTVCTKDRARWLASEEAHSALLAAWEEANTWKVGCYVLMPDHLHLFCAPQALDVPLDGWVRFWKSRFRKLTSGNEWRWQSHHWDTRMRRTESYAEKWDYVRQNPVRAALVRDGEGWPFQGELHKLDW